MVMMVMVVMVVTMVTMVMVVLMVMMVMMVTFESRLQVVLNLLGEHCCHQGGPATEE